MWTGYLHLQMALILPQMKYSADPMIQFVIDDRYFSYVRLMIRISGESSEPYLFISNHTLLKLFYLFQYFEILLDHCNVWLLRKERWLASKQTEAQCPKYWVFFPNDLLKCLLFTPNTQNWAQYVLSKHLKYSRMKYNFKF